MFAEIKALVSQNQTDQALRQLQEQADDQWEESILLLQSSQAQLNKEKTQQLISSEEAQRRQNNINAGTLELVSFIEQGNLPPEAVSRRLSSHLDDDQQNITDLQGASLQFGDDADVVVGSGNKIFKALGKWQFWTIVIVLLLVVAGGYFGIQKLSANQENAAVSLTAIQNELAQLANNSDERFNQQLPELKEKISEGIKAYKEENYDGAIEKLEEVARKAKLATVYQALEAAYLAKNMPEKAYEMRAQASRIDASVYQERPLSEIKGRTINLLAPENGGKSRAMSNQQMNELFNQSLKRLYTGNDNWIVFSFKDGLEAKLEAVDYYVAGSDPYNIDSFEILIGDAPTGAFSSIGTFTIQNAYLSDQPFQRFEFEPVRAKFVKFQYNTTSTTGVYMHELRLWGTL
jgi:hypothetical protein